MHQIRTSAWHAKHVSDGRFPAKIRVWKFRNPSDAHKATHSENLAEFKRRDDASTIKFSIHILCTEGNHGMNANREQPNVKNGKT